MILSSRNIISSVQYYYCVKFCLCHQILLNLFSLLVFILEPEYSALHLLDRCYASEELMILHFGNVRLDVWSFRSCLGELLSVRILEGSSYIFAVWFALVLSMYHSLGLVCMKVSYYLAILLRPMSL